MKKVKRISKILFYIAFFVGIWCLPVFSQEAYATSETELLQTAIAHLKDRVDSLETELDNHIQNDSTTDGRDGVDGKDGQDGKDAVLDKEANKESGSIIGTAALALACVSLLGNLVLTALMIKKKKN